MTFTQAAVSALCVSTVAIVLGLDLSGYVRGGDWIRLGDCLTKQRSMYSQGTLKEKTVENLEKFVVKDVSSLYSVKVQRKHTHAHTLGSKASRSLSLFFFFLFPPGEAASPPQSDERSCQGFPGHQQ